MSGRGMCLSAVEQYKSGGIFFFFFFVDALLSIIKGSDCHLEVILSPRGHVAMSGDIFGFHKICMVLLESGE